MSEAQHRFRQAFEYGAVGMSLTAPDGRFIAVNNALCELLGHSKEELEATGFPALTHPDEVARDLHARDDMLAGVTDRFRTVKRYRHANGDWVWVILSTALVRDAHGEPLYFVTQMVDVTDRQHAAEAQAKLAAGQRQMIADLAMLNEELRAASQLKSDFVAITSHELRTPLVTIGGFAHLLATQWDDIPEDERRLMAERIDNQTIRLGRLVEDLLTVSRLDAGAIDPYVARVSVGDAVAHALTHVEDEVRDSVVIDSGDCEVRADADHVQQILVNYLTNAARYGRPPVTVGCTPTPDGVEIRVRDRGDGVPADFVDKLFDRFTRVGGGQGVPGTGLGLAIVRGLAEANGGAAWYEPEPTGACFAVRLPSANER
jgi:PAS domain S-box-containing protein